MTKIDSINNTTNKMTGSAVGSFTRKLKMHYWYMDELGSSQRRGTILHGIVTGHSSIADSTFIHTSRVQKAHIDESSQELIVETKNSVYYCPLEYCEFAKQDERKDLVPDYDQIKAKYEGSLESSVIAPGNVLLVMSNFDHYYFHSLYCKPTGGFDVLSYHAAPNSNSFQDDFLIHSKDHRIELCYFPHFQNVEFTTQETDEMPFYIENIGDITLYIKTRFGLLELNPGDRKQVCKDNTRSNDMTMTLPTSDMFPDELMH